MHRHNNSTSRAEKTAKSWFDKFNDHKMIFGFGAMFVLTLCSIYFNMRLGRLNASPQDLTWWVMPLSYSFLDIALLCIAMCLFANVIKGLLYAVSWTWFFFLLTLSLFACLSCIVALDAEKASTGDAFKRQQLEKALADANSSVDTWQRNTSLTIKHKSRFQDRLDEATAKRDKIVNKIARLDESTPPSQVIFEKAEAFLPAWMDADMFKTFSRLIFGFAMITTPLLLTAILSQVFRSNEESEPDSSGGNSPPNGGRKTFSPGENDKFTETKWKNFGDSANSPAPISASARDTGNTEKSLDLDREALSKVRAWLRGQEGRITREQIKHQSGKQVYAQVTLIIKELIKEGWLVRMSNKQLKASKPELRAVI